MNSKAILITSACILIAAAKVATIGMTPEPHDDSERVHARQANAMVYPDAGPANLLEGDVDSGPAVRPSDTRTISPSRRSDEGSKASAAQPLSPASSTQKITASAREDESDFHLPTKVSDRSAGARHPQLSSAAVVQSHATAVPSPRAFAPARIGSPGAASAGDTASPAEPDMPAVLAGRDPKNPLPEEIEKVIDQMAEDFARTIEESGLTPEDPQYATLWQQAVEASDREFRARYGKQAWMRQHIEAHRMQAEAGGE